MTRSLNASAESAQLPNLRSSARLDWGVVFPRFTREESWRSWFHHCYYWISIFERIFVPAVICIVEMSLWCLQCGRFDGNSVCLWHFSAPDIGLQSGGGLLMVVLDDYSFHIKTLVVSLSLCLCHQCFGALSVSLPINMLAWYKFLANGQTGF